MTDSGFTVDVDQNQYLPEGGRDVSTIVTVASGPGVAARPGGGPGGGPGGAAASSAEIIIIDCSGSMEYPHYTGQVELAAAIQDRLEARKQGDEETATAKLGRAVALAHQSGNEDTAKLLAKVIDVVNLETGTVRLKKQVGDADEMALDTRSAKTVRARK